MNTLNKISFLIFFVAIFFTACQKENIDEIIPEDPEITVDTIDVNPIVQQLRLNSNSSESIDLLCLEIPLPVDFLQLSGNTISVNTQAEFEAASMLADTIVDFVYPFDAVNDNGTIVVENISDLVIALQECSVDTVNTECARGTDAHVLLFFNALNIFTLNKYVYTINYPVSLVVEGDTVVVNNDDEYLPAVGGSPSELLETDLVYPITITQFGRDIELNSDDDVCAFYETLGEACENKPAHIQFFFNEGGGVPVNCAYFINYPVEIVSNGVTTQIQSRDDYLSELNSSPTAYDEIELIYPASVTKSTDGQQIDFATEADICQYLDNCQ